jgi:hypothetical protein
MFPKVAERKCCHVVPPSDSDAEECGIAHGLVKRKQRLCQLVAQARYVAAWQLYTGGNYVMRSNPDS